MYFINKQVSVLENGVTKNKTQLKRVDAPVYRYWSALYMSFYASRLYVDVGKRWRGFGILYLFFMIAITCIPFAMVMSLDFEKSFNEQLIEPLSLIPQIYVQNGVASFDRPMPYLIKNKKNQVAIIIDTTGKISEFSNAYPNLNILIKKDSINFKMPAPPVLVSDQSESNKGAPLAQPFTKNMNFVFDGKSILKDNQLSRLKYVSQLMIYPLMVAELFSIFLVLFLVLGFLGQLFSRMFFYFTPTFSQSIRLFMVSATPMVVLLMIFLALNAIFAGSGIILLALLLAYYSFAIRSLRAESKLLVTQ
jgi:hypothetical protein